jgi:hypothetical protein
LAPTLALGACFGKAGSSQAAIDAQLIVTGVTPVAQNVGALGAEPTKVAVINQTLAMARSEATALNRQYTPGLLDVQQFYAAAQILLGTLGSIPRLPPSSVNIVDAATALLPTFAAVDNLPPPAGVSTMSADQARLILGGVSVAAAAPAAPQVDTPAQPVAAAPRAPTQAPGAPRFHLSADDVDNGIYYEFSDKGQVLDKGQVPTMRVLEARFAAFKKRRLQEAP